MKIIMRDKGISKYNQKKGMMTIDYDNKIFWLKMDVEKKGNNEQYIVSLTDSEVKQIKKFKLLN